jgi:hypothetical protein
LHERLEVLVVGESEEGKRERGKRERGKEGKRERDT